MGPLFLLFFAGCHGATNPAPYFDTLAVMFSSASSTYTLTMTTPTEVLCGISYWVAGMEEDATLFAMDMTSPATQHFVDIPFTTGLSYTLSLNIFLPEKHEVLRSSATVVAREIAGNLVTGAGSAATHIPSPPGDFAPGGVTVADVTDVGATISFTTPDLTLASVAFGTTLDYGRAARMGGNVGLSSHSVPVLALTPATTYHVSVIVLAANSTVFGPWGLTFTTMASTSNQACFGQNVALLSAGASVASVSSNFGGGSDTSTFGANKAIDGSSSSEWSSNGDGNNAFIEINLGSAVAVGGVGLWTRTMTTSAEISRFRLLADGTSVGEFDIAGADRIHQFAFPDVSATIMRLEVVASSGGNTGARSVEIYAATSCGEDEPPQSAASAHPAPLSAGAVVLCVLAGLTLVH